MELWMLSGTTLISLSTTFLVYAAIRLFLSLAFIIGVIYFGARLNQKNLQSVTWKPKTPFVSLGIGWKPRKEERRKGEIAERRQGKRTAWIASLTLLVGIGIGSGGTILVNSLEKQPPLRDVLITALHPDGSYTMVDGAGREFETTFCHGRDDLLPGNKLKTLYYRQEVGCKNIRGVDVGYKAYTNKDGTRMVFPIPKETAANVR